MACLKINDLQVNKQLDFKALRFVRGGRMTFGWIRRYDPSLGGSSGSPIYIGQMTVLLNPVFNQITQTVNQVQFVNVETTQNIDSTINVIIDQGQNGNVGQLPSFV